MKKDRKSDEASLMSIDSIAIGRVISLDEDIELISRVQYGDNGSFEILVEKYKAFVFGVIRSIIYETNVEEDLAQEAFLAAYRGIKQFRGDAKFASWLYRITYNVCLNHIRHNRREQANLVDSDIETKADDAPSPDKAQEREELKKQIDFAIRKLPPRYRSLIHLHYYENLRYEDISAVTGLPLGTVKSHLHRAKEKIKKILIKEGWILRE